jgi:hypothetical protein
MPPAANIAALHHQHSQHKHQHLLHRHVTSCAVTYVTFNPPLLRLHFTYLPQAPILAIGYERIIAFGSPALD